MLQEQVGNVAAAVPHGLVERIHAVAVTHVKVGSTLLQQHPHLCSAGGGPSATETMHRMTGQAEKLLVEKFIAGNPRSHSLSAPLVDPESAEPASHCPAGPQDPKAGCQNLGQSACQRLLVLKALFIPLSEAVKRAAAEPFVPFRTACHCGLLYVTGKVEGTSVR